MARYGTSFTQMLDPEPVKLSPIMANGFRAAPCAECSMDVGGLARWRWRSTADKELLHAKCVTTEEWTSKLRGGTALTYPKAPRQKVNPVTFTFVWADYDATYMPGTPTSEPPEEPYYEEDDDDEASLDYQYAA